MKKHLLMIWVAVMAATMSLNARVVLIDEGFENGIQDSVWTQENVRGEMLWAVESVEDGLAYPSTVVQGNKRAYLRNPSSETLGYKTRLISKVMDLRPTKVYLPELVFYYANPKWGADRDTLRVLYRTSARGQWKQLAEYSDANSDWQRVKLSIPEVTQTYQIAFEGTDNLGHGIVLDSIKLQSAPECTIPYDIVATNKGAGKVNISWTASYDADYWELIVTKDTIDPELIAEVEVENPETVAYHGLVSEYTNQDLTLEAGEFYLVYVRSLCEEENSAWSSEASKDGPFGFRVRTTKQIPFTENFNYAKGVTRNADWSWGSNTGKTNPFVNSSLVGKVRANYSPDTTAAVIFSGGAFDELTTVIPADRYVYMTTPALTDTTNANFKLNQCQVHFWGTVYTFTGRQYGRSIIVGVMDDPDDITTLTTVDTISVWGNMSFVESIVDLGNYEGNGSYIAFVSDFDRDNLFYLDNLTVEYRKAVNKVTKIDVNPRDTYATITWEGNASSYNVLITNAEVNPNNPAENAIVDQTTVTTNRYVCNELEADHSWNRPYYVYVQAAGQEWSYRYPFVTIASQKAIPYGYTFESGTPTYQISSTGTKQYVQGIGVFGNSGSYPAIEINSEKSYVGSNYLYLSQMGGKDSWITLPMVEDLSNTQVKFYLSGADTYDQAHASIGVMSNPMDINTYKKVADFQLNTTGYTRCYANFENYSGPDGVIAIVWEDVANMSKFTNNYIDELVVEELSECVPPTSIELEVGPDSITLGWEASALSDEWEIFISRIALKESDRVHKSMSEIAAMQGVVVARSLTWSDPTRNPQFGVEGLNPHTNYYLYVRATCDPDWWTEMAFSTPCYDEDFPFKETFEAYNLGGTTAGCWQLVDYMGIGYPKLVQASGTKALELYSSGTTHRCMAILPKVKGNLSNMMLTFSVRGSDPSSTNVLYVGTMEDITIQSTFVPFDTIRVKGNDFTKVRFILSDYALAYDNIAITSGIGSLAMNSDVLIDNVELRDPSCIEAYDFEQTSFGPHAFDLKWSGLSDGDVWQLKVLSSNVSINAVMNGTYKESLEVVGDTLVTGKTFSLSGLQAQKNYYVYIRTLCGDSVWNVAPVRTTCELLNPNKANKETFESYPSGTSYSDSYQAPCWTVGNEDPSYTTGSARPFLYSGSTYATSGTNSYRLYPLSGATACYIASPQIDVDSMSHIVASYSYYTSNSYALISGVMSDPTDLSTFVVLDSFMTATGKNQITIELANYASIIPPTAKYFAVRSAYNATAPTIYLDDFSFISNACPMPKPSISELTTNSVRVSGGMRTNDPWVLMITNTAISDENLSNDDYVVPKSQIVYIDTLDRRSKEVVGLEGQTKYYIYTATLCDSVTHSQWSSLTFTTPCESRDPESLGTITFSEEDGFTTGTTGEMPCWIKGSKTKTASATYQPYISNTSSYQHNGNRYLYFYDYVSGTTTVNVGGYAIMPALEVDSISKYQVNFWGRGTTTATSNSQIIVGVVTDPSDLNTFVPMDTLNLSHSAWDPYSVGFEKYDGDYMGDMGKNIMFLSDFGKSNYAYISEISVELIPRCRAVSSFSVDSVGENSAVVSWKGYQDSYRLLVADKALTEAQKPKYRYLLDTIVDHSDEVLISNLKSTTYYYVYAQGICGGGDSTAISMTYASFRTECPSENGAPLPFTEDFETYKAGDLSFGCWQTGEYGSSSGYPKILNLTSGAQSGLQLELWSTSTSHRNAVMMPLIDADLADCRLTFDTRSWSTSARSVLYIGTMSDITDPNTFEPFDTVYNEGGTTFNHVTLDLADYELFHDYIAFSSGLATTLEMASDVMIDNIVLERVATCSAPRLKAISTSYTEAEIALTPVLETDSLWEIVVISEADYKLIADIAQYLETATKISIDTTDIVLNNLEQAKSYYIFARTICSEEDISAWSRNPLKISTQFYYADSYHFGFEKGSELWQRSMYSVSDNYYLHPALVAGLDNEQEVEAMIYYPYSLENSEEQSYSRVGTGALRMYGDVDMYGGYIIYPTINDAKARSFEFKVRPGAVDADSKLAKESFDGMFEIGTIEKDKSFETYEPLATIHLSKLNPTTKATAKNNQLFSNYSIDFDAATMANRQVVLYLPKQASDTVNLFFDEVSLGATKGFSLVGLNKVETDGVNATVEWANIGGPWNLTIQDENGQTVRQYLNLTTTSQLVEDLEPRMVHTAILSAASVPSSASSYVTTDKLTFRTQCPTMELEHGETDFTWSFDNAYEWELNDVLAGDAYDSLYYKPACFNVGITYRNPVNGYQWLVQRKGYEYTGATTSYNSSARIEVGRNDSHALRVHTTDANFNSYIVLPALDCDLDTMMIEFYGRCFVNYDQTYTPSSGRGLIVNTAYLGSAYSQSIVVGTLTDPSDFSTLQVIDTLTYTHTNLTAGTNVNNDPNGLRYWDLMQLPLDNAQGKYIVLFQPAAGLFYLDDLSVKPIGNTLFKPKNPHITATTATSVSLEWGVYQPEMASVVVLLDATGEEVSRTTVSGTSYEITGLQPAMNYQWYVYQTDGEHNSPATKPISFATECVTVTPAYTCSFEDAEGWKYIDGQTAYKQTLCWTYSDAKQGEWKNANYDPYNEANTNIYKYAYSGSHAVMMRASSGSRQSYQPYIVLPRMDVTAYDTLQVMFWMRPAYVYAATDSVVQSYTGTTYAKSVIVGTMTDPENAATFVPIDTVTYDGTITIADKAMPENDYLFQQMAVELAGATGPYVAIMTSFREKGGKTQRSEDFVWIDDISFEHKQECKDPTDLEALIVGAYHATLQWNGIDSAASYILQVSTDPYFIKEDNFVYNGEVKSNTYKVEGLEPLTTYVWRVQAVCGERWGDSRFSQKATFTTSRCPYFLEEFSAAVNNNEWLFSKTHADNVVDGTGVLSRGIDSWGFVRTTKNFGLEGSHYVAQGHSNDYHWMITPNLYLPEDDSVHFSADIALTACNTAHVETANAVTENDMKDDYYFMIILSDDGGKTWKSENILAKWQNTNPEGQQLRDISATGQNVRFSLAQYAGKNIRVGFYREAKTTGSTGIAIHVDNVRFAYYDKNVSYASTCQYEDITVGDIHLSGDDTEPGIHTYPKPYYASDADAKAGVRDSVQQLEIEVFPAEETFFADTICEGDTYTGYEFLPKDRTGVYRRKLHTAVHGCDSIVTLNLYVKERRYGEDTEVSICQGETFEWKEKIYNRAGIYRDTTVSSIGCDSIETLVISYYEGGAAVQTIYESSRVDINTLPFTYENALYPYAEGQDPIYYPAGTPKGTYKDTVKVQGEYCTNTLIHTLTIYDPLDAIDVIGTDERGARKVIVRDQMYIILNDEWYTTSGQKVRDPRK